jgi:hypothetical protein
MIVSESPNVVYTMFFLRGKGIDPEKVTETLNIVSSYKFKEGDAYGPKKEYTRKLGFWSITSDKNVISTNIEEHLLWIIDQLEPVQTKLAFILLQKETYAQLTVVYHLYSREWSSTINPELLRRIAALDIAFGVSLYRLGYPEED